MEEDMRPRECLAKVEADSSPAGLSKSICRTRLGKQVHSWAISIHWCPRHRTEVPVSCCYVRYRGLVHHSIGRKRGIGCGILQYCACIELGRLPMSLRLL